MIKILTILQLFMAFLTAAFSGSQYAISEAETSNTKITVNSPQTYQDGYFQISVEAENFNNVSSLELSLFYDSEYFEYNYQEVGWLISNSTYEAANPTPGEAHFYMISNEPISGNGTIWYVNLYAKKETPLGKYPITVAVGEVYDNLLNLVNIDSKVTYVEVIKGVSQLNEVRVYNSCDKEVYYEGNEVEIRYNVYDGYGFSSAYFDFYYDDSILKLEKFEVGSDLKNKNGAVYSTNNVPGNIVFTYVSLEGVEYAYNMFVLKFTVIKDVDVDTFVQLQVSEMYDVDLKMLRCNPDDTLININKKAEDKAIVVSVDDYNGCDVEFSVFVNVKGNPSLAAADFTVSYDTNNVVCTGVEKADDNIMIVTNPDISNGIIKFSFLCEVGLEKNTAIVKLNFKRIDLMNDTFLSITGMNLVDEEFNDLEVTYKDGDITPKHNFEYFDYKAPTCTEPGWNYHSRCVDCGYGYSEIPASGHHMSGWYTTINPTCLEEGLSINRCYFCDYKETKVLPKTEHNCYYYEGREPTCTENGYKDYEVCWQCGYSTYEEIPALGHDLIYHDEKAPTCTEDGHYAYEECSRCDYSTYQIIYTQGHSLTYYGYKEPTCTEDGHYGYLECSVCDYTTYQKIPAYGHALTYYDELVPTCTEDGHNAYEECSNCDYTTYQKIHAYGHALTYHDGKQPTCEENGYYAYEECSKCDYSTYQIIYTQGHSLIYYGYKEPTCTENGHYGYEECTRCNHTTYQIIPAYGHALTYYGYKDPTCTEDGHNAYEECWVCGYSTFEEIPATGHSLTYYDAKEPTCTEDGHNSYEECSKCDYTTYQKIPAYGHALTYYGYKSPTCTEDGHNAYEECSNCDYTTYQVVPSTGHSYDKNIFEPTCVKEGYTQYICSKCSHMYLDDFIDALDHNLVHVDAKEPTTEEHGWYEYDKCTRCDYTTIIIIPSLNHEMVSEIVLPTCEEQGYTIHTCVKCNETFVDTYVPALGHDLVEHEGKQPTCEEEGYYAYEECSRCDYHNKVVINSLGHSLYSKVVLPTCEEQGYTVYSCKNCNHSYKGDYVDSLGHNIIKHEAKLPTCEDIGWNAYEECTRCNHTTFAGIPALGHDYESTVTPPTCEDQGYTTHTCSRCNDTYKDSYEEALGHTESKAVKENEIAPTCKTMGSYDEVIYCSTCHKELSRTNVKVNKLEHTEVVDKAVAPTCTTAGLTEGKHCSICNQVTIIQQIVPALGHDYESTVTPPTCEEQGYTKHTCSRCNDTYKDSYVAKLDHDLSTYQVINPTCEEQGYTIYECVNCNEKIHGNYISATGHDYGEYINDGDVHYQVCSKCNHESEKEQHILEDNKCIKCDYKNNIVIVIVSIVSGVITGIIGLIFFLIKKRK